MSHPEIKYVGCYSGPGEWGGIAGSYDTQEEALVAAHRSCHRAEDRAWANPEFTGPADTILVAVKPLAYTEWKPARRVTIAPGETISVGTILGADHHTTRGTIARWLLDGDATIATDK